MAEEKTYVIPLRKEWLKVPIWNRTPKAVRAVKEFVKKHTKTEDVRIGKYLNQELWKRGNRKPPAKVRVQVKKVEEKDQKYVKVELVGAPEEEKKEEKKKGILEKITGKKEEKKEEREEEPKEETEEEPKEEKKEESKETKKKTEKKGTKKHSKKTKLGQNETPSNIHPKP